MLLIYTMKEIQILHWLLIVFFVGLVIFYFVQRSSVVIGKEGLETNSTMPSFKIYTTNGGTTAGVYLQAQPNKNGEQIPTVSEYSEGTSFYIDSTSFKPYKLISSVDNKYFLRLSDYKVSGNSKNSSQTGFISNNLADTYMEDIILSQLGTSNLSTPISNNQELFTYMDTFYYADTTPPVVTPSPLPSPPVVTPSPLPSPPVVTPSPLPSPPVVTPSPLPSPPGPTPPNMICTPAGSSGSSDQINVHKSKYNYNLG